MMRLTYTCLAFWIGLHLTSCPSLSAAVPEETRVKRQEVFEFTEKPKVTRDGDNVTITFTSKALCDATVTIDGADGAVVRHLASGVLGPHAPKPFLKGRLKQSIVWDGKDDRGRYVDNLDRLSVRVSLGLKPQFERTLNWCPYKRTSKRPAVIRSRPEGVYVYDTGGAEHIRLFDHAGAFLRTVYPPPADKLEKLKGLNWQKVPQTGQRMPARSRFVRSTLLTSGIGGISGAGTRHGWVWSATDMAVMNDRIALTFVTLNRLATDGASPRVQAGQDERIRLQGPRVARTAMAHGWRFNGKQLFSPQSTAFSPDGKWLYMTGYMLPAYQAGRSVHGVLKMEYASNKEPEVFVGKMTWEGHGNDNAHFRVPAAVACDPQGRVYVADYVNNRVQVYSPDAKFLKTIPVKHPAWIQINPRNGEIYTFSYALDTVPDTVIKATGFDIKKVEPRLRMLGTFETPGVKAEYDLPGVMKLKGFGYRQEGMLPNRVELDFWSDPLTLWIVNRKEKVSKAWNRKGIWTDGDDRKKWLNGWISLYELKDKKWVPKRKFNDRVAEQVVRVWPPDFAVQRLNWNPKLKKLYVVEYEGWSKTALDILVIDPETGKNQVENLPFGAEDVCFDIDGNIYIRDGYKHVVARYDPATWREIPWDYGEERPGFISLLPTLGNKTTIRRQQAGMFVSTSGHLLISSVSHIQKRSEEDKKAIHKTNRSKWEPKAFKGRTRVQEMHLFDKHGKLLNEDVIPGLGFAHGIALDDDLNVYVQAGGARCLDGKRVYDGNTGALIKFKPGKGRVLSTKGTSGHGSVMLLPKEQYPNRPHDLWSYSYGEAWVEDAEWFYGGVGFMGGNINTHDAISPCVCWETRFAFDRYRRSFVVENDLYGLAAVDANGNLMMRFGRYGNVEDGKPLIAAGGPTTTRSIGGDEVALFRPTHLASDGGTRLFVADIGNARILSVKLGYQTEARVPLAGAGK